MREWMLSQRTGIAKTQFRAPCIFIGQYFGATSVHASPSEAETSSVVFL
jgi:hypothetical protein